MNEEAGSESILEALPFFKGVPAASRARLLQNAMLHSVPAGTILFEQGEQPNFQHLVMSGSIHLFGRSSEGAEVLIEVVEPSDLVIPAAIMTGAPYLMRARVPEPSRLLLIQAAIFRATVLQDPALAQAVISSLSGQFRRLVRQIKNLKLRSAVQRVGCYVLALSRRQGDTNRVILPYEKNLIASKLGITRESFSRALFRLQKDAITVQGEVITIRDPARLAAVSGPDPLIDGPEEMFAMPKWTTAARAGSGAPSRERHG